MSEMLSVDFRREVISPLRPGLVVKELDVGCEASCSVVSMGFEDGNVGVEGVVGAEIGATTDPTQDSEFCLECT